MSKIKKMKCLFLSLLLLGCTGLGGDSAEGPGMIITLSNSLPGKEVSIKKIITDGIFIPSLGSLPPSSDPKKGGSTMGFAPDTRGLPEWVEFQWKEWPYPFDEMPDDFAAKQVWNAKVDELSRILPIKSERIKVRERVPADVVERLMQARRNPVAGQNLKLWVTFRWYPSGIRFHWELNDGCCDLNQEGGDVID